MGSRSDSWSKPDQQLMWTTSARERRRSPRRRPATQEVLIYSRKYAHAQRRMKVFPSVHSERTPYVLRSKDRFPTKRQLREKQFLLRKKRFVLIPSYIMEKTREKATMHINNALHLESRCLRKNPLEALTSVLAHAPRMYTE